MLRVSKDEYIHCIVDLRFCHIFISILFEKIIFAISKFLSN